MKFAFRFSNLLGTVYRRGDLTFTPDGSSVISPVGNRLSIFNLKNNKAETLPFALSRNIVCVGQSPDGHLAILVDEEGVALLVSLLRRTALHHFNFHSPVHSVAFSPDGRKFVVTKENVVLMYHGPGQDRHFNPFSLDKTYYGPYDETTCIAWTDDSKCFAVGSKDSSTWVFGAERWTNLIYYSLGGHKDAIVSCFFEAGSLDVYTLSRDATLCVWECDTDPEGLLLPGGPAGGGRHRGPGGEGGAELQPQPSVVRGKAEPQSQSQRPQGAKVKYTRTGKHFFNKEGDFNELTAAAYHRGNRLLVTGFANGSFLLHDMPDINLIHSLSISDQSIASISINSSGDWIAFGCAGRGQLLVWEWQSESYVMKQQGHFNNMVALSYSPDAQHIVTGGDDGKVKVWDTSSGLCTVTFTDHSSGVTAVTFNATGYVVVSSSLDGTVRAFDLHRYRNFRTFTSPRLAQFSCLALDPSGEIVCAGARDSFEVFVWSMQSGRLLDVLAGHEGPVSGLSFSPTQGILASASWDKTVKLWDMQDSWSTRETLRLGSDGLAVSFRPDGGELAVATLDGNITLWDHGRGVQTGSIEGQHHLHSGRRELDMVTARHSAKSRAYSTLCYSADGGWVLAGGQSRYVCIYNVKEQILVKSFEISCNLSLDGMEEFLDRRKMTEFGSVALIDEGAGEDGVALPLPGVKKGDMSRRHFKPEIRVTCLRFSPTGRSWAATSTEGLLIFSLDGGVVFDPYDLDEEVTPVSVRRVLRRGEFTLAIAMAFRLNEDKLTLEVLEGVPHGDVGMVCSTLPLLYVGKLLGFMAAVLESSRHLEFFLSWAEQLLSLHGQQLKARSVELLPAIQSLQRSIQRHYDSVSKLCEWNRYNMRYTLALAQQRGLKRPAGMDEGMEEGSHVDSDASSANDDQLTDGSDWGTHPTHGVTPTLI